jgi:cytochrome c-type biogenesis protein CcmF
MVPELGHFALVLALVITVAQASVPLLGSFVGNRRWMEMARPLARGQLTFVAIAFVALLHAFLTDDFSVEYVAGHSNTLMPLLYKVSAIWGGHEGSLLLWALMAAGWGAAVAAFSKNLPLPDGGTRHLGPRHGGDRLPAVHAPDLQSLRPSLPRRRSKAAT